MSVTFGAPKKKPPGKYARWDDLLDEWTPSPNAPSYGEFLEHGVRVAIKIRRDWCVATVLGVDDESDSDQMWHYVLEMSFLVGKSTTLSQLLDRKYYDTSGAAPHGADSWCVVTPRGTSSTPVAMEETRSASPMAMEVTPVTRPNLLEIGPLVGAQLMDMLMSDAFVVDASDDAARALVHKIKSVPSLRSTTGDVCREIRIDARRAAKPLDEGVPFQEVYDQLQQDIFPLQGRARTDLAIRGMYPRFVGADGNCMYRAIGDQLYNDERRHAEVRRTMLPYIKGEFNMQNENCHANLGCYGNHATLQAVSDAYELHITVFALRDGAIAKMPPVGAAQAQPVWLLLVDETHYWSLRSTGEL